MPRDGQDLVLEWGPINRLVAKDRLLGLGFTGKAVSYILEREGRHARGRPPLWVEDGDMIGIPLTAGSGHGPAEPVGGTRVPSTGVPPSMATSRSSAGDAPVTVTEPVPALGAAEDRLRECAMRLAVPEKDARPFAYFMRPYMADRVTFEAGMAAYPQMLPPVKKIVSLTWSDEQGWSPGAGFDHGHVREHEAPREKWVAFNGEILRADAGDPGALDLSSAVAQAQLQQGKMAIQAQAPVPAPDSLDGFTRLAESAGVTVMDIFRILGGGDNTVAVDADAAVQMAQIEEAKSRRIMIQDFIGKLPGIVQDVAKVVAEGKGGEVRARVLRRGQPEAEPEEATSTLACSGCGELVDYPSDWSEFRCPSCDAETTVPGSGQDTFGGGERGKAEQASDGSGQGSDGLGEDAPFSRESGVRVGAAAGAGAADSQADGRVP